MTDLAISFEVEEVEALVTLIEAFAQNESLAVEDEMVLEKLQQALRP